MAEENGVKKKDYLELELSVPVEHEGVTITKLDLSKLREMTGRDLNEIYDLYASLGGDRPVMQEGTLLFAQIVASRASGYPVEAIMDLKAKDSAYLKNRVYRFFYLTE